MSEPYGISKCTGQTSCYGCPHMGDTCDGHESKEDRAKGDI